LNQPANIVRSYAVRRRVRRAELSTRPVGRNSLDAYLKNLRQSHKLRRTMKRIVIAATIVGVSVLIAAGVMRFARCKPQDKLQDKPQEWNANAIKAHFLAAHTGADKTLRISYVLENTTDDDFYIADASQAWLMEKPILSRSNVRDDVKDALLWPPYRDEIKDELPLFVPPKQKIFFFTVKIEHTTGLDSLDRLILYDRAHRYIIDFPVR
jgi:hypothetical protein